MQARKGRFIIVPAFAVLVAASIADRPLDPQPNEVSRREILSTAGAQRQYGAPMRLGNGRARTYVEIDGQTGSPIEVGVAIDSAAMVGLSTGPEPTMLHLSLPRQAPAPYQFVMLDWNPQGHEPVSVYTLPHFDFHFYTISQEELAGILPEMSEFATRANHLPPEEYVPEHYIPLSEPGQPPASVAVPQMGVHWLDVRSPELQAMLGNPEDHHPFTRTFIYGSWDGRFTFYEPMITLAHLMSKPSELIPVSRPAKFSKSGWYPSAYRIHYDARASEYRVGLAGLSKFD